MTARTLPLLLLALVALHSEADTAPSKTVTPSDVLERLQSDKPLDIAWGAWLAGEHDVREARPLIAKCLRTYALRKRDWPTTLATHNLLDAAIRLRVLPSRIVLVSLSQSFRDAVPTLAILHGGTPDETLLALYDRFDRLSWSRFESWLALGNHMHRLKTPGFGVRTLRRLRFHRRVQVWDRYGPYPDWRGPSSNVPGDGLGKCPPGFPPIARYRLSHRASSNNALLTGGPRPIYVSRSVDRDGKVWTSYSGGANRARPDCRLEWVHMWLEQPATERRSTRRPDEAVALPALHGTIDIRWTGRQPWVRQLRTLQETLHAQYWGVVRELVRRGLVTEAEARTVEPTFELRRADERNDKRRALPPIPVVEPRNPWAQGRRQRR